MITWVTMWVLTVHTSIGSASNQTYQLTYATQSACINQIEKHKRDRNFSVRCDFQQIPVVVNK